MSFTLPELSYSYDALEPVIDAETMEIHHSKHHAGYTKKLNAALEGHEKFQSMKIEELLQNLKDVPEEIRKAVHNNGGGFYNHSLFWEIMAPGGSDTPEGNLLDALENAFDSVDEFQKSLNEESLGVFGSGWAWLAVDGNGDLQLMSTPNQDSPVMHGLTPILGIDVWEHAYYLKHQNKRAEYVKGWWDVVNWDVVAGKYENS